MTTYTATNNGEFRCLLDSVETMLSRCHEVQTFLAAGSEAIALLLIQQNAGDNPTDNEERDATEEADWKPFVFCYISPENGLTMNVDAVGSWDVSGTVVIQMERLLASDELKNPSLAITRMQTTIGRVCQELMLQEWADASTQFERISARGPFEISEDDANDLGRTIVAAIEIMVGGDRG